MTNKKIQNSLETKASAAFEIAAHDVIAKARASQTEIVIWRNGQVLKLSPDQAQQELTTKPPPPLPPTTP